MARTEQNRMLIGGAVVAVLVALLLGAWALGWFHDDRYSSDPAVAEVEKLRDQFLIDRAQKSNEQLAASRLQLRQRIQGLSEPQRRTFVESSMPIVIPVFMQEIDNILALPPDQQRAAIDQRIDQMVAQGGPLFAPSSASANPERMSEFAKQLLDWTSPDDRAKFGEFMLLFRGRMSQRGIAPPFGGGLF